MARVTVEDCLERLNNRFALVLLVSKRAKQILKGSEPVVSRKENKYVVTALREVAEGLVRYDVDPSVFSQDIEADLNKKKLDS
ncbi:MAG: DNA-directed RNA polymerase subunit omega [Bdellovibrionales bacterium]|nr:DNA-directed RNA polymerase subunit omega [Bdellovibrionales bacterium]